MSTPRMLVTLDGSELAAAAILVGAQLAHRLDARATLLRVVPPRSAGCSASVCDSLPSMTIEARRADDDLHAYEPAFSGLCVEQVVLTGSHPAQEIVNWLRSHSVDLVVMATHGNGRLHHLLTEKVADAIIRSGLAPVITVRPFAVPEATARTAGQP
jgi:nucleotide-binding universal stress UspA family protein